MSEVKITMSEPVSFSDTIDKQLLKLRNIQETIKLLYQTPNLSNNAKQIELKYEEIQDLISKLTELKDTLNRQRYLCEDVKNLSMLLNDLVDEITRLQEVNKSCSKISHLAFQARNSETKSQQTADSPSISSNYNPASIEGKLTKYSAYKQVDLDNLRIDYIDEDEYYKLPRYMVGRIQMDVINKFVDVVNKAALYKYDLLSKPKLSLKGQDLQLVRNYRAQEIEEIKGKFFITEADIARQINKKNIDKHSYNLLIILRHIKRINEHRTGRIVRYMLILP